MSGNKTQGIIKLTGTEPLQNIKPQHEIKIDKDTKLSQLIDAGANPAPLVSQVATETVIAKAQEHGFGIVGVHNFFSSNGAQAFYAEKIAGKDLIGIVLPAHQLRLRLLAVLIPYLGLTHWRFHSRPIINRLYSICRPRQ